MARRSMRVAAIKEILVHWDAGETISGIAGALGYSRPTVRKYVQAAEQAGLTRGSRAHDERAWERLARATLAQVAQDRPARPPTVATVALTAWHDYLAERVGQVRLSVLYQRVHDEHQLAVSWATFYRYVRAQWPERLRPAARVTVPLADPPPGEEGQVDFFWVGLWEDPQTQRRRKLWAFLLTLAHSRHAFLYPVLGEDSAAWLEAHVAAFSFFGGAPRRLVPDNLTAGILKPDRYDPQVNRAYGELVRYYGCLVDPARVRRPTDKPRVERNVDYARHSFFDGRTFASLAGMRADAERWCREIAGQRIHGTTGERPYAAVLACEQATLRALPPRPWEPVPWQSATVQRDCRVRVAGAPYSVPHQYVGRQLDVRLSRTTVEIYDGPELVTTHVRQDGRGATRLEHYPAATQAFLRATPAVCRERAQALGPATSELVGALLEPYALYRLREVQALLRLAEHSGGDRLELACRRALDAGDGHYRTVRGLLERGLEASELSGGTHDAAPATAARPLQEQPAGAATATGARSRAGAPPVASTSPPAAGFLGAFLRGPAAFAALVQTLVATGGGAPAPTASDGQGGG